MSRPIVAILLAAGASNRVSGTRQLVLSRGRPLVRIVAQEALGARCERVAVVVGACASEVVPAVDDLPIEVLKNAAWDEGVASAIRCGVAWAQTQECEGALVIVCDPPLPTSAHLNRLIAAQRGETSIVASRHAGVLDVPVLFGRRLFPALLALRGDQGPRRILRTFEAQGVDWPEWELDDVAPEELERLSTEDRVVGGTRGAS